MPISVLPCTDECEYFVLMTVSLSVGVLRIMAATRYTVYEIYPYVYPGFLLGLHVCFFFHECVCKSLVVQAPAVLKQAVLGKLGNFKAAPHVHVILWVADRKRVNCQTDACWEQQLIV